MSQESFLATDFKFALATISQIIEENRGNKEIISACKNVASAIKEATYNLEPINYNIELSVRYCLMRSKIILKLLDDSVRLGNKEDNKLREDITIIMEIVEDKIKELGENIR